MNLKAEYYLNGETLQVSGSTEGSFAQITKRLASRCCSGQEGKWDIGLIVDWRIEIRKCDHSCTRHCETTPGVLGIVWVILFKKGYAGIGGSPEETHWANIWDKRVSCPETSGYRHFNYVLCLDFWRMRGNVIKISYSGDWTEQMLRCSHQ